MTNEKAPGMNAMLLGLSLMEYPRRFARGPYEQPVAQPSGRPPVDRTLKFARYGGTGHYWIVEPVDMDLDPWELRDPGTVITELARRHELRPGRVVVGLVHRPTTDQRLVASTVVHDGSPLPPDRYVLSKMLRDTAEALWGDTELVGRAEHAWITLVVGSGRVVFGPSDAVWLLAWRYANAVVLVFGGEHVRVTEHGWRCFMSDAAGSTPQARRVA